MWQLVKVEEDAGRRVRHGDEVLVAKQLPVVPGGHRYRAAADPIPVADAALEEVVVEFAATEEVDDG